MPLLLEQLLAISKKNNNNNKQDNIANENENNNSESRLYLFDYWMLPESVGSAFPVALFWLRTLQVYHRVDDWGHGAAEVGERVENQAVIWPSLSVS